MIVFTFPFLGAQHLQGWDTSRPVGRGYSLWIWIHGRVGRSARWDPLHPKTPWHQQKCKGWHLIFEVLALLFLPCSHRGESISTPCSVKLPWKAFLPFAVSPRRGTSLHTTSFLVLEGAGSWFWFAVVLRVLVSPLPLLWCDGSLGFPRAQETSPLA